MVSGGFESEVGANPLLGSASNYITQSIEAQQYILGMLYQKIGIQSTFNMKRERLTDDETQLDTDPLRPLIDAMLEERQNFCKAVNEKYGLNISVEFNSSWSKYNEDELVGDQEEITEEPEDGQINLEPQTETVAEEDDQIGNEETTETDTEESETVAEDAVDKVEEAIETIIEKAADQIVEGAFDDDEEKEDNDNEDESGDAESDD